MVEAIIAIVALAIGAVVGFVLSKNVIKTAAHNVLREAEDKLANVEQQVTDILSAAEKEAADKVSDAQKDAGNILREAKLEAESKALRF